MNASLGVTGVLLAAGGSTRLGQAKQLLNWHGQPLIVHATKQLWDAGCDPIVVVLGAAATQCRQSMEDFLAADTELFRAIVWLENQDWRQGQFGSLKLALNAVRLLEEPLNHVLVAVGDQPQMLSAHYRSLMAAVSAQRVKVAATLYQQGGGVPACFRHDCTRELLRLQADAGAKAWIRNQSSDQVSLFDFGDAVGDIDTLEDWQKLLNQSKGLSKSRTHSE